MFFALSKILLFLLQPSSLIAAMLAAGTLLVQSRFAHVARRLLFTGTALLVVLGLSPLGGALILPLEERFSRPMLTASDHIDGIIVLGGGEDPRVGDLRGVLSVNEAGERMAETVALARKYPNAKVVFTGGSAELLSTKPPEAEAARKYFGELGLAPERLTIEAQSRNTFENAAFTRKILKPNDGERWLLVTSAYHMPRAIGCFRKAGFKVEAFPVDYRTAGLSEIYEPFSSIPEGLRRMDFVFKEYVGLVTYYLTGRSSELFPGPQSASPSRAELAACNQPLRFEPCVCGAVVGKSINVPVLDVGCVDIPHGRPAADEDRAADKLREHGLRVH